MFFWRKNKDKNKIPVPPKTDFLNLKDQIERQLGILNRVGLLQTLQDGKTLGIIGIDEKEYALPTREEIMKRLESKRELAERKKGQGFTKLIIVPFACPLEKILEKYKDALIAHHQDGKFLATKKSRTDEDERLELNVGHPINLWNESKEGDVKNNFIYFPQQYDKENHKGKTKLDIISTPGGAWQMFLIEDMPNIPSAGKGKLINHRKQIEAGKTPKQYFEMLLTDKNYEGEEGLIPEADLVYALTSLEEDDQVINDWQGRGNISYELAVLFASSLNIPWFSWNRDFNRADLWISSIENLDAHIGARTGIRF